MLNGMALFAGIGGLEIGLAEYVRTVCYVERDNYAVAVLRSRIKEGRIDDAPIWDDVRTFEGRCWNGLVDVITGGFPCQDISVAGKGKGIKSGTKSGLWFEFRRIINEIRPSFVFVENVSALTYRGLDIVLGQLSEAGYDAKWTDLRTSDVGAPHRRERIFILAYPKGIGLETFRKGLSEGKSELGKTDKEKMFHKSFELSFAERIRRRGDCGYIRRGDGVPNKVDRIKCLGNAVVPEQAKKAWEILTGEVKT